VCAVDIPVLPITTDLIREISVIRGLKASIRG
jgi:hypothetical protein